MIHRLLILGILIGLLALAAWDIARRNPQLFRRPGARRPGPRPVPVPPTSTRAPPTDGGANVLPFARPPHEVLGVEPDADRSAVEEAYRGLLASYSPEKLGGMSDELRELAERRTREIERAYRSMLDRLA